MDEFLTKKPRFKSFINGYVKKKEDKIQKELDREKAEEDELIEKAKELFEPKPSMCNNDCLNGFKYKLELLEKDESDHKILKNALIMKDKEENSCLTCNEKHVINLNKKGNTVRVYRVITTDSTSHQHDNSTGSQVLLLHGTKASNVEGILEVGFKPSKCGIFGPGVYLTDSFKYATSYGKCFVEEQGVIKCLSYFFVNKINQNDVEVLPSRINEINTFQDYLSKTPVVQVFKSHTYRQTTFENSLEDKFDSSNNRILQGTFQQENDSEETIVSAHHSLVVPVYLLEIEETSSVKEIANYMLYANLNVEKFILESDPSKEGQKTTTLNKKLENHLFKVNDININKGYTLMSVTKALKEEISANRLAKLKHLKSGLKIKIDSIIKQLTFNYSSLFETNNDIRAKYKMDLLQKENKDYKLISNSFIDEKAIKHPKILHLFKISPTDENETQIYDDKCLYMNSTQPDEIGSILTSGYPKEHEKNFVSEECVASNYFHEAIYHGKSYCEVEGTVKKLSFVFLVISEDKYEDFYLNDAQIMKTSKDSRQSLIEVFYEESFNMETCALAPAYLIILETN